LKYGDEMIVQMTQEKGEMVYNALHGNGNKHPPGLAFLDFDISGNLGTETIKKARDLAPSHIFWSNFFGTQTCNPSIWDVSDDETMTSARMGNGYSGNLHSRFDMIEWDLSGLEKGTSL